MSVSLDSPVVLRVYIVDDSPEERYTVRRLLKRAQNSEFVFDVSEADTAARGLALCRQNPPDCLLLDYHLGDSEGTEFLAELRDEAGDTLCPVVVMTAAGTEDTAVRAMKAGAQDYLLKGTITPATLRFAVENAMEKVRLQRRLRTSEARFRASLDNMLDCFGIFSPVRDAGGRITDFRIEYVNDAGCLSHQRTREEQMGSLLCEMLPGHRANGLFDDYVRVVETGEPLEKQALSYSEDSGKPGAAGLLERAFDLRAWKMGEEVAAAWRDVTSRVQAEQARDAAEERLAVMARRLQFHVENTPLANIEWDGDLRVRAWSRQAEEMFGWAVGEILGRRVDNLPFVADQEDGGRGMRRLLDGEGNRSVFPCRNRRQDGRVLHCEWYNSIERAPDGRPLSVLSLVQDVTAREEALTRLAAQYRREREIAASLQRALLSKPRDDAFPGLHFHTTYLPASQEAEVGGDFFDVFDVFDGRVAFVVGDISGKGLEAARHIAAVKFSLRAYLRDSGDAARALGRVNLDLYRAFQEALDAPSDEEFQGGHGFVCLSLVLIEPATGRAEVASAGAEPPLLLRAASGVAEGMTGAMNAALGVNDDEAFTTVSCALEPGDLIVQVTDGITEARRGDAFLGFEGLIRAAQAARTLPALDRIAGAIVEEARRFGQGVLRDDVCLLLTRRDAPPA